MTETYLEESDTLVIDFNENQPFTRIHPTPGIVILLDEGGHVCGVELENASVILGDMEYLMVGEVDAANDTMTVDDYDGLTMSV